MKKSILMVILAVLVLLVTALSANAAVEPYYHGEFADDTTGCAKCHVTHAGSAAALLVDGPTQTDFCLYCHGDNLKSPYNAADGKITTATGFKASVSGGFEFSYDFDNAAYDEVDGANAANYLPVTSMHGVETYDNDDWTGGTQIPGGADASNLVGNFRCGSCHDPHAGGAYTPGNGSIMPRLLKTELPAATLNVADHDDWTFTAVADSWDQGTGEAQYKTRVTTGYGDNAGVWCAGCHDLFNQTAADAGQTPVNDAGSGVTNRYMHRMNFTIDNDAEGVQAIDAASANVQRIALSVGNKLTCLTCHRAHGTSITVTNDPVWNRAATYKNSAGGTSATSNSTVLLREENRDVCFHCHGAAENNKPSQQGS